MRRFIFWLFLFSFVNINYSISGEITDLEWSIINRLEVTYYSGTNSTKINCTAFTKDDLPIGGNFSYTSGGVARISIEVPQKYQRKKLKVSCKEK